MKSKITELRITKEKYVKDKLEFYKEIKKNYPNCFIDVSRIKQKILEELSILLSSIPIHKTVRYKVYQGNGNWDDKDILWRPPYNGFYEDHQSYALEFFRIGNPLKITIKKGVIHFIGSRYRSEGKNVIVDFNKIPNLHQDKVAEFIECLQEFLDLDKELSMEKNDVTLTIDDDGTTEFKLVNNTGTYCLENSIHLEDTGISDLDRIRGYSSNDHINNVIKNLGEELKKSKPSVNEINMKTIFEILTDLNISREIFINKLKLLLTKVESKNYTFKLIQQI